MHRKSCTNTDVTNAIRLSLLEHDGKSIPHLGLVDDKDFKIDILNRFRSGDEGELCRSDPFINTMGYRHYCSRKADIAKQMEYRKCIMSDMQKMAWLYL